MSDYIERYWRDATPADAIKEPPMVARFLSGKSEWFIGKLCGCWRDLHGDNTKWGDGSGLCHTTCQVYDAPDPGEGWRLIDPEKDDYNQNGVEYWNIGKKRWLPRDEGHNMTSFCPGAFYRRRIEQPKPKYEPFRWEDREKLKGRWIAHNAGNLEVCPMSFFSTESNFFVGTQDAQKLLDHWHFMDTGEPVGGKVQ